MSPILKKTLLLAAVILSVAKILTYTDFLKPPFLTGNDYAPDYISARAWLDGDDPYAQLSPFYEKYFGADDPAIPYARIQGRNPHPPALILLQAPLSHAGFKTARTVWLVAMLLAGAVGVWLVARELGFPPEIAAAMSVVAMAMPVVGYDMRWAQTNALLMLGLVLAWRALRRDRDVQAGVLLGIVAALKVFPLLLLLPLLRRGRVRAVASMLGSSLALTAASSLVLGVSSLSDFLTSITSGNVKLWVAGPLNLSLPALPVRWLAPELWRDASLPVPGTAAVIAGLLFIACVVGVSRARGGLTGDEFWGAVPWVLLAAPIAWPHYLVLLLPVGVLLICHRGDMTQAGKFLAGIAFAALMLGQTLVVWISDATGISLSSRAIQYGGVNILTAALLYLAVRELPSPVERDAHAGAIPMIA